MDAKEDRGQRLEMHVLVPILQGAQALVLEASEEAGLTPHEALHSWVDGLRFMYETSVSVCVEDYCSGNIAKKFGMTLEEIVEKVVETQRQAGNN